MAKLLSIVWYKILPAKYGGQKGIARFNEALSKHHSLVCLCSRENVDDGTHSYKIIPRLPAGKLQFINPYCWWLIYHSAIKNNVTHLLLEHPYYGIAGWLCKKLFGVKLIVHSHNIEYERFKKQRKWWWWWLLKHYECWAHQQADLSLFKTAKDQSHAMEVFRLNQSKCMVVSYGIDTREATISKDEARAVVQEKHRIRKSNKIVLFAATLDYSPNAKAVENIYAFIAPLLSPLQYNIIICGRNLHQDFQHLKKLQHESVVYAGEVEDIHTYYAAADAFINPIISSSGIQTKTIDALSQNLNVVCFDTNIEGLPTPLLHEKLFIAPANNWNEFIAQMHKAVVSNRPTPFAFIEQFSWQKIAEGVAGKIDEL